MSLAMLRSEAATFFVGTASSPGKPAGILRCELDQETGALAGPEVAADAQSPSFLAVSPDGKFLYAGIASMRIDESRGTLEPAGRLQTGYAPVSFSFLP